MYFFFFFQAEDGIRDKLVTGVQTCALPIWVNELKAKTGRTLEEWCDYIVKEGPDELAARRDWLKTKHKLGTNTAWWLAERRSEERRVGKECRSRWSRYQ